MAKKQVLRTARIHWKPVDGSEAERGDDGEGRFVDVFAPALLANVRMVDRRLAKAGLPEFEPLVRGGGWHNRGAAAAAVDAAERFFDENPTSIPFSGFLVETFAGLRKGLDHVPAETQVRFEEVEIDSHGLDHGSVVIPTGPAG